LVALAFTESSATNFQALLFIVVLISDSQNGDIKITDNQNINAAQAVWSIGIASSCHRGDWSYGS
jgi:hypothetical protein